MGWFPVMLEFAGRHCLVAGGGATALRKTNDLLAAEAEVTVIAREMLPAFTGLAVRKLCRDVCAKDIDGMQLVVDATGDPSVGHMLAEACQARQIFFNAASDPQQSTALFPAVLRRGPLVAGFSTTGASPTAAAWLRDRMEENLSARFEEILLQMRELRSRAREQIPQRKARAIFLRCCFDLAMQLDRPLTENEICTCMIQQESFAYDEP